MFDRSEEDTFVEAVPTNKTNTKAEENVSQDPSVPTELLVKESDEVFAQIARIIMSVVSKVTFSEKMLAYLVKLGLSLMFGSYSDTFLPLLSSVAVTFLR